MKRVLISVSDKTGIVEFAQKLISLGYELISTGGTYNELVNNKITVTKVSDITDFPEMMDGRVKTLHPKIHGGLLYLRDNENHVNQAKQHNIYPIDMLVINLYPFEKTINNPDSTWEEIIENIDIGGPAMLRSGAKNYRSVTVIIDPNDYETVLDEITKNGDTTLETRQKLAQKVYNHTANYDSLIAKVLATHPVETQYNASNTVETLYIASKKGDAIYSVSTGNRISLRYGENPHQSANYHPGKIDIITQLHGKELSYNNLLDIDAALKTIIKFTKVGQAYMLDKNNPTVAIFKHTNPCGIASANNITEAYKKAFATDTISPFGGIIITNSIITPDFAEEINKIFMEIIIAPDYSEKAIEILKKKKDRRLIKYNIELLNELQNHTQIQACINGYLTQEPDLDNDDVDSWTIPTDNKPSESDFNEAIFAWQVVKMLKSNAICFTKNKQTLGMGIGQTSRIDSMNIAIDRAGKMGLDIAGSICASDGFFPFRDSIDLLAKAKVKCVIQPGGSKADPEVISACNEHNIAMIITGKRHFRH